MKKLILSILFAGLIINLPAQKTKSNNSSLDSLKQGMKNIGKLFKKASAITVTVNKTDAGDKNLNQLIQSIKQITGVTKIKENYGADAAVVVVSYKGNGTGLWTNVPQNSKQLFELVSVNDSSIRLNNKYPKNVVAKNDNGKVGPNEQLKTTPEKKSVILAGGESTTVTKGAAVLFSNVKSKLGNTDKNGIFKMLGFKLSKDGKQFAIPDSEEFPFDATVYPVDLNKDGIEEIFVSFGNTYTSGNTGSSINAFIAGKNGGYQSNLGFPGTIPNVLPTANLGYPDLLIGGPGFEFPVQRWNGKAYDYYRTVKDREYEKLKMTSLEKLSKAYTETIK